MIRLYGWIHMTVLRDSNALDYRYLAVRALCDCRMKGLEMEMWLPTKEEVETIKKRIGEKTLTFGDIDNRGLLDEKWN
jgi:hypothetical protein